VDLATRSASFPAGGKEIGSSSVLILMAKSEVSTIYVQHELESWVCQRTNSCKTDFAISIKNDEEPGNRDEVWAGGASTQGAKPPRATGAAVFVGWRVSVYDGSMIDVKP
jgi:hypothetical protein